MGKVVSHTFKTEKNIPLGSECFPADPRSVRIAKSELYVALSPFVVAVGEDKEYRGLQLAEMVSRKSVFEFMAGGRKIERRWRAKKSFSKSRDELNGWSLLLAALTPIERRRGIATKDWKRRRRKELSSLSEWLSIPWSSGCSWFCRVWSPVVR